MQSNTFAAYLEGQAGVAFAGRKALWASNINLSDESYLYDIELPPLSEGQVIFLSFPEALNRDKGALKVVERNRLHIVEEQTASDLSNYTSPLLAKLAYFDQFPENNFSYCTEPNMAYFFSSLSIVCNFEKPYTAVPLDSITIYPNGVNPHSNATTSSQFPITLPPTISTTSSNVAVVAPKPSTVAVAAKPPLVRAAAPSLITPYATGGKNAGKGGKDSEGGYTTLPSASSMTSQDSVDLDSRRSKIGVRTEVKGYLPETDVYGEVITRRAREVVGGAENPQLTQLIKEGRQLFSVHWAGIKQSLGWGHDWFLPALPAPQIHRDIYLPPLTLSSDRNASYPQIENVSYFRRENFDVHLALNPSLIMEWGQLWPLLKEGGWRSVSAQGGGVEYVWAEGADVYGMSGEWGVHRFKSKLALAQFIARFPYPLQTPVRLAETLERHGWRVEKGVDSSKSKGKKAEGNLLYVSPQDNARYSYSEVVKGLWADPSMLFCNYPHSVQDAIREYLALPKSHALAPDTEPSSPEVERMSNREREMLMVEAVQVSKVILGQGVSQPPTHTNLHAVVRAERRLAVILEKFGWTHTPLPVFALPFANAWWKWEKAFIPPYASSRGGEGDAWMLGVDYFFLLKDVAVVLCGEGDKWGGPTTLYISPLKLPPARVRLSMRSYNSSEWSLERRVYQIAFNEKAPFQALHYREMLRDLGWGVGEAGKRDGVDVYVPPMKKGVKGKRGVDYLIGESEVIEYLMKETQKKDTVADSPSSVLSSKSSSPSVAPQPKHVALVDNSKANKKGVKAVALFPKGEVKANPVRAKAPKEDEKAWAAGMRTRHSRGSGNSFQAVDDIWNGWISNDGEEESVKSIDGESRTGVNKIKEAKEWILEHLETSDRPYMPVILPYLTTLGWKVVYSSSGDRAGVGFFLAPWGLDKLMKKWTDEGKTAGGLGEGDQFVPYTFHKGGHQCMYLDLSPPCPLVHQVDFFYQDYDRAEMIEVIKARGRKRGWRKVQVKSTKVKAKAGKGVGSGSSSKKRNREDGEANANSNVVDMVDDDNENILQSQLIANKKKKQRLSVTPASPAASVASSNSSVSVYSSDCPPEKIIIMREVRKPQPFFGAIVTQL
eukprot:gene34348-41576_t